MAAQLVTFVQSWRQAVAQGSLQPETVGNAKLDSSQYHWLFNACRIPATPIDYATKVAETDPRGDHVLVIRNDEYYSLPLKDANGQLHTIEQLQGALEQVWNSASSLHSSSPVGVLTGLHRDDWAKHYGLLSKSNTDTLAAIETAAFVLVLEDEAPSSVEEFSRDLWHGTGHNRWWDKPLQWVLYRDGSCGFVGEHSCMDGSPTARLNSELWQYLEQETTSSTSHSPGSDGHSSVQPQKLSWKLSDELDTIIDQGLTQFQANSQDTELRLLSCFLPLEEMDLTVSLRLLAV